MAAKIIIFVIIVIALLAIIFAYNYFTEPKANAPIINEGEILINNGFKGPYGPPSMNGPDGPPPSR